jgi:hypothetical protein
MRAWHGWHRTAVALWTMVMAAAGCTELPTDDNLPERVLSRVDHDVYFPIDSGDKHEGLACSACHLDEAESFATFTCVDCHRHEQPDMDASHAGIGGYAYSSPSCFDCHPRGDVGLGIDHEPIFPIANDTAHGDVGCGECHLDLGDASEDNLCASCHATLGGDVIADHADVGEFAVGTVVDSTQCKQCHGDSQVDAVADHSLFLIAGDAPPPHAGEPCLQCHTSAREDKPWATDFGDQTCLTCHEEAETGAQHGPVADYLYETASCLICHSDGSAEGIDHAPIFPIDVGSAHEQVTCAECHTESADVTVNGCRACHETVENDDLALLHIDVGELVFDLPSITSADCKRCHGDSQVDAVADHGPFLITDGEAHHTERCLDCHTSPRVDKPWAADFAQQTCLTCHEEPETNASHGVVPDYVYATASCLLCHPDGSSAGIDHTAYFPIAMGSAHAPASCADCHTNSADVTDNGCRECHETVENDDLAALHTEVGELVLDLPGTTSADCKRCHAESQVDAVADHGPFLITAGRPHHRERCLQCHTSSRADKTWAADFTQKTCLTCHEQTETAADHAVVPGFAYDTISCLTCHPDGEGALNIDHEPIFPLTAPAAHDQVSCGECHLSSQDTGVNGCAECHVTLPENLGTQHNTVGGAGATSPSVDCKRCHADSQVYPTTNHQPFSILGGPHGGEPCLDCHQASRIDKPWGTDFNVFSCSECHSQNEMNDKHSDEDDYAYDFPTCLTCHPDGRNE